ncbi:hypothetical protein TPA0598_09_03160 [Streptomyces lydicamycinicus]|uniref:Uncharacterized protein n=1 Tax=Streptomyces lydicamycinicus TaxID=1546107 RepID=A0A0P4RGL6_9ACTN|nr:hypothetical protein TPA0598_09_03160 [Streptomyces lydicamycinicus]
MAELHLPRPDYRIDGFKATTEQTEEDFSSVTLSDDMFLPLVEHHSADGRDSYLLMYDWAAIWDVPGTAEYVTLHISRDDERRTFDFASEAHPTVPLAQNWMIGRGCPDEAVELSSIHWPRPADALTSRLEEQLRVNPDGRYTVVDTTPAIRDPPGSGSRCRYFSMTPLPIRRPGLTGCFSKRRPRTSAPTRSGRAPSPRPTLRVSGPWSVPARFRRPRLRGRRTGACPVRRDHARRSRPTPPCRRSP